ncbi:MAG: glycosyltransferase WbuB, partial [Christensenellaceae bacterium]
MNIWLINHYAVPPQYYPLARQTYFAKYLMEMGHSVTIFAASTVHNSNQNLITDGAPYREETVNGVHYVYIRCRDYTGNGVSRIYNMMEFAWKLPGVCKRFPRPDAIVATSMPPVSCAAGIR